MIAEISGLVDLFFSCVGRLCGIGGTLEGIVELDVADPAAEGLVLRERRLFLRLSLLDRLARLRPCEL